MTAPVIAHLQQLHNNKQVEKRGLVGRLKAQQMTPDAGMVKKYSKSANADLGLHGPWYSIIMPQSSKVSPILFLFACVMQCVGIQLDTCFCFVECDLPTNIAADVKPPCTFHKKPSTH